MSDMTFVKCSDDVRKIFLYVKQGLVRLFLTLKGNTSSMSI